MNSPIYLTNVHTIKKLNLFCSINLASSFHLHSHYPTPSWITQCSCTIFHDTALQGSIHFAVPEQGTTWIRTARSLHMAPAALHPRPPPFLSGPLQLLPISSALPARSPPPITVYTEAKGILSKHAIRYDIFFKTLQIAFHCILNTVKAPYHFICCLSPLSSHSMVNSFAQLKCPSSSKQHFLTIYFIFFFPLILNWQNQFPSLHLFCVSTNNQFFLKHLL